MAFDPNDPTNNNPQQPNQPQGNQPIDPRGKLPDPAPMDLNKLFNFEDAKKNINKFFQEMLDQLKTPVDKALKDMESKANDTFKEIQKSGKTALEKVGESSKEALKPLEDSGKKMFSSIEDEGKDAMTTYEKIASSSLDKIADHIKKSFKASDFEDMNNHILATSQKTSEAIEKEDKRTNDLRMKYLKATLSQEEYNVVSIIHERDELLKHIEDEYKVKQAAIQSEIKDQETLAAKLDELDEEREQKKKHLHEVFAKKELEASGEGGLGAKISKALSAETIAKKGQDQISAAILGTVEKMSSFAVILGGISSAILAVFAQAQKDVVLYTKLATDSRNSLGIGKEGTGRGFFDALVQDSIKLGQSREDVAKFIDILSEAPAALKEASTSIGTEQFKKFRDEMGAFGVDAETSARLVAKGSTEWNMGLKDLHKTLKLSIALTHATGLRTTDTMNSFLNLNAQLRSVSFNSREAATVMIAANKQILKGFGPQEVAKFQQQLGAAISGLKPNQISGMFAFVNKRMPGVEDFEKLEKKGGVTALTFQTLIKQMGTSLFGKGPEVMGRLQSAAGQIGFSPGLTGFSGLLDVLKNVAKTGGNDEGIDKIVKEFEKQNAPGESDMAKLQREGNENLQNMADVSSKLESALQGLLSEIAGDTGLTKGIMRLNTTIGRLRFPFMKEEQYPFKFDTAKEAVRIQSDMKDPNRSLKNLPAQASRDKK